MVKEPGQNLSANNLALFGISFANLFIVQFDLMWTINGLKKVFASFQNGFIAFRYKYFQPIHKRSLLE
jgi:hypothetical protein